MSNAELDNLIDAFLIGELDSAGRERLVVLLESDDAARRSFDEALRTEALLRSAHAAPVNSGAEKRAMDKLKLRLKQLAPAPERAVRSISVKKPAVPNRFARPQRPIRALGGSQIGIWTALAASIAILFGLAFYFIYEPATKSGTADATSDKKNKKGTDDKSEKNSDVKPAEYTVASGRVTVDGKDVRDIAENEWISVGKDMPAALKAKDGTSIKLEGGARVLLRKRGATLMSGAARFGVQTAKEAFVLHTPLGTVDSTDGEFEARLDSASVGTDPATARKVPTLAVTVASGSVLVECGGKNTRMMAGQSRIFSEADDSVANVNKPKLNTELTVAKFRPHESKRIECILRHDTELGLTNEQRIKLNDIAKKLDDATEMVIKDSIVKDLYAKQLNAEDKQDEPSARRYQKDIHERSIELLGPNKITDDPMDILNDVQRQKMEQLDRDHDRTPGAPRFGDDPHPRPPRPPFPPPGKDAPPPPPPVK